MKKILTALLVGAVMTTAVAAQEATEKNVAYLAYDDVYLSDLQNAFTAESNPNGRQVLMADNWTGDIDIVYPEFASSFYLNGYKLDGQLKISEASIVNLYGVEPGNQWAGDNSLITGGIWQSSVANLNISGEITVQPDNDGIAIYANNGKVIIDNKDVDVNGDIVAEGTAIVKISAGTYTGTLEAATPTNLEITGGIFTEDPSEFLPAGFIAVKGADDYYTVQEPTGTLDDLTKDADGKYVLSTAADIVRFRTVMSKQNIAAGTEFVLANDIDMTGITLAPAGNDTIRFSGNFDGQNNTISNVVIEGDTNSYVAFFGNTSGATIKNLTIENVTVTGGQYIAGLVGRARSTTINNCKVIGNINISGHDGVGAVVGGGVANITNCEVDGTGTISGEWDVAAIAGLVSAGTSAIDNNSVKGVEITAERGYAGGIAGRVLANGNGNNLSISGNEISDVEIDSGDRYSSALIAGSTVTSGVGTVSYAENAAEKSVLYIDGEESDVLYAGIEEDSNIKVAVAKIGDVYYYTLQSAIDAAAENDTIILISDIDYDNYAYAEGKTTSVNIPAGKKLTLDLNGHTISGKNSAPKSFELITICNGAVVTIDDTSSEKTGKITYEATREAPDGWINRAHTIFNQGTLILNGGTIENATPESQEAVSSAIDNNCSWGNLGAFYMNGGVVTSAGYYAIRTDINTHNASADGTNKAIAEINGGTVYGFYLMDRGNTYTQFPGNDIDLSIGDDAVIEPTNYSGANGTAIRLRYGARSTIDVVVSEEAEVNGMVTGAAAKVGGNYYGNLGDAVNSANNGDTVTLVSDVTLSDVLAYADRNASTWNGSYAYDIRITKELTLDLNGYTIKSTGGSDTQHYAIICVDGAGDLTIVDSSEEKTGAIVNATTSRPAGKMNVVLYSEAGDITLNGGTYSNQARVDGNYPYVIDSITAGDTSLTINEGVSLISDGYMALRAMSQGGAGTQTVAINGGEIVGGIWAVLKNGVKDVLNFTISGGTITGNNAFIVENYAVPAADAAVDTVSITGGTFYGNVAIGSNNVGNLLADGFISGGVFSNDVSAYTTAGFAAVEQYEGMYKIVDEALKVEAIEVKFEDVTADDAEGEKLYNINLVATDDDIINRLNSADLTFVISNTTGATEFEIIASNKEVAINSVNNSENRYEFHYNGKDNATTETANTITIGQVKFTGYGVFTFAVDTNANDTNAAHATKLYDNIVDTFIPDGDTTTVANGELVIDNSVINTEILVPTRDLVINIDFPNAISDNKAAYQDMTVTVSGADLEEDLVVELGEDGAITDLDNYITKTSDSKAVAAVFENGAYKVTITDLLNVNTSYTVTVEGAGYRTARYTVTMTEDKELNFWNNVKDNAVEVEEEKASSAKNVTFLAGDIVKDSVINIYDLSAVVSYFGEIDLNVAGTANAYAKYDLNRDGKIDSKDVAYVLVSWNN